MAEIIVKPVTPRICEAKCYGNCNGKVNGRKIIYHCRPKEKNSKMMIGYDQDVIVDICDLHYEWLMLTTKGKTPEMYGSDLADAIDMLSCCCDFRKTTYTFWYCAFHDDGVLIHDENTNEVPEWCKLCGSQNNPNLCCKSGWCKKGVINYDGKNVIEIEKVVMTYGHPESAFNLAQYAFSYIEKSKEGDRGKEIMIEKGTVLVKWFYKKLKN